MIFEYEDYVINLLKSSLNGLLLAIFLMVFASFKLRQNIVNKNIGLTMKAMVFFMFMISFLIIYSCVLNLKYGIYLINEKETMSKEYTGSIENIEILDHVMGYSDETGRIRCRLVTIDGDEYLFVSTGDLEIGDSITIDYLPKSRVVLEWEYDLN